MKNSVVKNIINILKDYKKDIDTFVISVFGEKTKIKQKNLKVNKFQDQTLIQFNNDWNFDLDIKDYDVILFDIKKSQDSKSSLIKELKKFKEVKNLSITTFGKNEFISFNIS